MFWLTMSSNISMKFSVITYRIASLRVFLWAMLGSFASFIFVLLESGTGYLFSSFSSGPVLSYSEGENGFHTFFIFPPLHFILCN
jgi:hypothetical protein